jgi:hypothetical protein
LNYGAIIYSAIVAREMPSGMNGILFMISKMNILGTIYMKDFSYKKLGCVSFALHFGNSHSRQGGVIGKGNVSNGQGRELHYVFLRLGGERLNSISEWDNMMRIRRNIISRKT